MVPSFIPKYKDMLSNTQVKFSVKEENIENKYDPIPTIKNQSNGYQLKKVENRKGNDVIFEK